MLKQIAWNTFKNTGNIDTMMELIQVDKATRDTKKLELQNDMDLLNSISNNKLKLNNRIDEEKL